MKATKFDRAVPWIFIAVTALVIGGLSALVVKLNGQRKAEWSAYAKEHGCERVATRRGAINVTVQQVPIGNSNVATVPTVTVEDDVHAWRCSDGSTHLNRWR